jgi:ketosteroid isomerase-like protein
MKKLIFRFILLALLAVTCFQLPAQDKADVKAILARQNKDMIDLAKAGRFEALEKYYDSDAMLLPNNFPVERGFKEILASHNMRKKAGYKMLDGQATTTDLLISGDLAVEIGTYSFTVTFPGPPEPVVDEGKYMTVWRKQKDGSWKIYADMWNTNKGKGGDALKTGAAKSSPDVSSDVINSTPPQMAPNPERTDDKK